jgi:peptide deformylase
MKRVLYFDVGERIAMINPEITFKSREMFDVWDDCMCFPELFVKVQRYVACKVKYRDVGWVEKEILVEGDMSELFQHEFDHLDGILAVSRAIDAHSFSLASER